MNDMTESPRRDYPIARVWIHIGRDNVGMGLGEWFPHSPYHYLSELLREAQRHEDYAARERARVLFRWFGYGNQWVCRCERKRAEYLAAARPHQDHDWEAYWKLVLRDYRCHGSRPEIARLNEGAVLSLARAVFADPPERYQQNGSIRIKKLLDGSMRFWIP